MSEHSFAIFHMHVTLFLAFYFNMIEVSGQEWIQDLVKGVLNLHSHGWDALSLQTFSLAYVWLDATVQIFANASNFPTEDQKRSQPTATGIIAHHLQLLEPLCALFHCCQ